MSKLKVPVLSLGAKGTIADSLTFRQSRGISIAEKKPIPTDKRSLGQQYQRWFYEDYSYLWSQQSQATRSQYRTLGLPHRLTAFQYWMKYHLANLPDILALFYNDSISAGVVTDISKYHADGAVVGAVTVKGLIGEALWFDGENDKVDLGSPAHLKVLNDFTVSFFARYDTSQGDYYNPCGARHSATHGYVWQGYGAFTYIHCGTGLGICSQKFSFDLRDGLWHHLAHVKSSTLGTLLYVDGQLDASNPACTAPLVHHWLYHWNYGYSELTRYLRGEIDHFCIRNRCQDPSEILRHALRRYP